MENNNMNPVVIIISLVIGAVIGYFVGTFTADTEVGTTVQDAGTQFQENVEQIDLQPDTVVTPQDDEEVFTISMSQLSDDQQTILRTAGVDDDEIVITRAMVVCAEAELGAQRVAEIEDGATITMSEGVTLVACYNDN